MTFIQDRFNILQEPGVENDISSSTSTVDWTPIPSTRQLRGVVQVAEDRIGRRILQVRPTVVESSNDTLTYLYNPSIDISRIDTIQMQDISRRSNSVGRIFLILTDSTGANAHNGVQANFLGRYIWRIRQAPNINLREIISIRFIFFASPSLGIEFNIDELSSTLFFGDTLNNSIDDSPKLVRHSCSSPRRFICNCPTMY